MIHTSVFQYKCDLTNFNAEEVLKKIFPVNASVLFVDAAWMVFSSKEMSGPGS